VQSFLEDTQSSSCYFHKKQNQFHRNTRMATLDRIAAWAEEGSKQLLYLQGAHGVGKTTL
jgi:hypothetical protein